MRETATRAGRRYPRQADVTVDSQKYAVKEECDLLRSRTSTEHMMSAVLLVDDDVGTLEGFEGVLRSERFEVVPTLTGQQALEAARRRAFDVALVDLHLPDMSGLDLIRQLRIEGHAHMAFVIVTGFGTVASAVQALKLGAVDYVEKPLIGETLVAVVRSAADRRCDVRVATEAAALQALMPASVQASATQAGPATQITDARVKRALQIIEQRYAERRLTVRTVADELGVACEYFCRLFKRYTGFTFGTVLDERRIQQARKLLCESTLSCKEIAARVGYEQTGQLDRHFRKRLGVNPNALRRSGDSS